MAPGKQSRAQLLINLAVSNNVTTNQDINFLSPDQFISNGYDPTNLPSCNTNETLQSDISNIKYQPESYIIIEELPGNQYVELNADSLNTLPPAPQLQLINGVEYKLENLKFTTNYILTPPPAPQLELSNVAENELQGIQYEELTDNSYTPPPAPQLQVTNENINFTMGYILNEATGEFIVDNGTDRSYDDNYYLDENTGRFLLKNEIDFVIGDEDQFECEFINKETISKNRHVCKANRQMGKKYLGRKRKLDGEKPCFVFVEKPKKYLLQKPCNHSCAANSDRSFLCGIVSETKRKAIFQYFWTLSWEAKKAYLKNIVRVRPVQRRRKSNETSQKHLAYDYFLTNDQEELVKVCKNFLSKTLNVHTDTLSEWVKESQNVESDKDGDFRSKHQKRVKHAVLTNPDCEQATKEKTPKADSVRRWVGLLNKVPSHYCRASSTRVYVEDTFESKSHMYRIYTKWCMENRSITAGRKLFNKVLDEQKVSIYKPRKDQCDVCFAKKEGNISDEEYSLHIIKKEEAYKAQIEAYAMSSSEVLVVTVDVQAVLLSPKLLVSAQYYKTKLQLHNYTIYINNNKDVHLYVWHEGNGGVSANEFTSCIVDFIKKQTGYKKICIISDGCAYQNRNKVLSSALLALSVQMDIEIEQIILEKGHTMMKVDSVHSTLERKFRPPIYAPCDYISKMIDARPSQPYHVNHLDYTFFKNYERCICVDSIRPGKKSGDPTVNDIRALLYKDGAIFYKLRHSQDWDILPQRVRRINQNAPQYQEESCKIDKTKYESLQSLKSYMHRDYHTFYDSLRYE